MRYESGHLHTFLKRHIHIVERYIQSDKTKMENEGIIMRLRIVVPLGVGSRLAGRILMRLVILTSFTWGVSPRCALLILL